MNRPSSSLANLYGGVYEPGKTAKYQLIKSAAEVNQVNDSSRR